MLLGTWLGRCGGCALFTALTSLADIGTGAPGEHYLGMKGIKSSAHEVLYIPFRLVVAAGEDLFTK